MLWEKNAKKRIAKTTPKRHIGIREFEIICFCSFSFRVWLGMFIDVWFWLMWVVSWIVMKGVIGISVGQFHVEKNVKKYDGALEYVLFEFVTLPLMSSWDLETRNRYRIEY